MNGDEIVDFASQMQAELFYSERCLASSPQEDKEGCFGLQIMLDGKLLEFEGVCAEPAFCTYPEFAQYYREQIVYNGPFKDDLYLACN